MRTFIQAALVAAAVAAETADKFTPSDAVCSKIQTANLDATETDKKMKECQLDKLSKGYSQGGMLWSGNCLTGTEQSPINLDQYKEFHRGYLRADLLGFGNEIISSSGTVGRLDQQPSSFFNGVTNINEEGQNTSTPELQGLKTGMLVKVDADRNETFYNTNGGKAQFIQPAEHLVTGKQYPLELQFNFGADPKKAPYTTNLYEREAAGWKTGDAVRKGTPVFELPSWTDQTGQASKIGSGRGTSMSRNQKFSVLFEEINCGDEVQDIADEDLLNPTDTGKPSQAMSDCIDTRDANSHFFDAILREDVDGKSQNCLFQKDGLGDYIGGSCTPKSIDLGRLFAGKDLCKIKKGEKEETCAMQGGLEQRHFYMYAGSSTRNPDACPEGVDWVIYARPLAINPAHLKEFTDAIQHNLNYNNFAKDEFAQYRGSNRGTQALNNRRIYYNSGATALAAAATGAIAYLLF